MSEGVSRTKPSATANASAAEESADAALRAAGTAAEPTAPQQDSTARGRVRRGPAPFEWLAYGAFVATLVYLNANGLRGDWNTVQWTLWPFVKAIPRLLALGIGAQLTFRLIRGLWRRQLRLDLLGYLRALRSPGWWWLWLRLLGAYMATSYTYFWLKITIPLIHPRLFDPWVDRVDQLMHLGIDPTVVAIELLAPYGTLLAGLDWWYGQWIGSVMLTIAFACCATAPRFRRSFMTSCCLLWILGAVIYVAVPVLGPIFAEPQLFEGVLAHLDGSRPAQAMLRENYSKFLAARDGAPLASFNPTHGIAALPSLHVGAHVLLWLWFRRRLPVLRVPLLLMAVATFAGSVVTGWHYAVDGYAGALLAWACYRLALRWEPPEAEPLS